MSKDTKEVQRAVENTVKTQDDTADLIASPPNGETAQRQATQQATPRSTPERPVAYANATPPTPEGSPAAATSDTDWDKDEGMDLGGLSKWAAIAGGAAALFLGYRGLKSRGAKSDGIEVKEVVTINKPADELYHFWRNFENLPRFMKHLESVRVQGETRSHWKVKAPAGMTVEWDAEITQDKPNELIAWRSLEKAQVPNHGVVRFKPTPGNRGTEVSVELQYSPPGGKVGAAVAKLFREEPSQQVEGDLKRFKSLMESGEIPTTEGQPHGKRSTTAKLAEAITQQ